MATFTQTTTGTSTEATPPTAFREWAITANGVTSKTVTRCSPFSPTTGRDSLPARGRLVRPGAGTGPALTAAASAGIVLAEIDSVAAGAAADSAEDLAGAALEAALGDFGEAALVGSMAAAGSAVWSPQMRFNLRCSSRPEGAERKCRMQAAFTKSSRCGPVRRSCNAREISKQNAFYQ